MWWDKNKDKPSNLFYISVFCTWMLFMIFVKIVCTICYSPVSKGFDCIKNAQEIGKVALYSEMLKDFIKDVAGIKNEIDELKKQKETIDKIKKQNEEIIEILKHKQISL